MDIPLVIGKAAKTKLYYPLDKPSPLRKDYQLEILGKRQAFLVQGEIAAYQLVDSLFHGQQLLV